MTGGLQWSLRAPFDLALCEKPTLTKRQDDFIVSSVTPPTSSQVKTDVVAHTRPPAKLNLFLELLARRDDGFHEIDTVMVPIDWRDELQLRRTYGTGNTTLRRLAAFTSCSGRRVWATATIRTGESVAGDSR